MRGTASRPAALLAALLVLSLLRFLAPARAFARDTAGDTAVRIPSRSFRRARDMMGRGVAVEDGRLLAGPSPLYVDLTDDTLPLFLSSGAVEAARTVAAGQTIDAGGGEYFLPQGFTMLGTSSGR